MWRIDRTAARATDDPVGATCGSGHCRNDFRSCCGCGCPQPNPSTVGNVARLFRRSQHGDGRRNARRSMVRVRRRKTLCRVARQSRRSASSDALECPGTFWQSPGSGVTAVAVPRDLGPARQRWQRAARLVRPRRLPPSSAPDSLLTGHRPARRWRIRGGGRRPAAGPSAIASRPTARGPKPPRPDPTAPSKEDT